MTPKERLLGLLSGKKVDRPPFICPGGMMSMAVTEVMEKTGYFWPEAHRDAVKMARLTQGVSTLGGVENYGTPFCLTVEAEALGAEVDLGSRETEPHVKKYIVHDIEDFPLNSIDVTQGRAAVVLKAIEILASQDDRVPIIGNLTGPFSLATSLVDPLFFLRALERKRDACHKMLKFVTKSLIQFGKAQLATGANVIVIADPSATGEILGPVSFKEFVLPYLNQISEELEANGTKTIVHICGRAQNLTEELKGLEAAALSVDSVVNLRKLREKLPDKVLMGNVSTQILEWGTPEHIIKAGKHSLKSGAHILAPACGISPKTKINSLRALASVVNDDVNALHAA